jgi:hypothetical protein
VDQRIHAVLQEHQPFDAWHLSGRDPTRHPLVLLHDLWNRDKHQGVTVTTAAATLEAAAIRVQDAPPGFPECVAGPVKVRSERPLVGETEVGTVRIDYVRPIPAVGNTTVHVDLDFVLQMLFGKGTPAEGEPVLERLAEARDAVVAILDRFR